MTKTVFVALVVGAIGLAGCSRHSDTAAGDNAETANVANEADGNGLSAVDENLSPANDVTDNDAGSASQAGDATGNTTGNAL